MKDSIYRHWMKKMEEDHEVFFKKQKYFENQGFIFFIVLSLFLLFYSKYFFFPVFISIIFLLSDDSHFVKLNPLARRWFKSEIYRRWTEAFNEKTRKHFNNKMMKTAVEAGYDAEYTAAVLTGEDLNCVTSRQEFYGYCCQRQQKIDKEKAEAKRLAEEAESRKKAKLEQERLIKKYSEGKPKE